MDDSGSQLDLSSDDRPAGGPRPDRKGRFLGVTFECCGVYARIYPNARDDAYEGRCPRCMKAIKVPIGEGGSSSRFFRAN